MTNTTPKRADLRGGGVRVPTRLGWSVALLIAAAALTGAPAAAIDLALPGNARLRAETTASPDSYALPVAGWTGDELPTVAAQGRVTRRAWRIDAQGITTLQLLDPLKQQLLDGGYETLFECATRECGGFDFRFSTDVFAEPDMHVDLFDFRFLSAQNGTGGFVSVLVSRSSNAGFVQVIQVTPPDAAAPVTKGTAPSVRPEPSGRPAHPGEDLPLGDQLLAQGHSVLGDLAFQTGSSDLGPGPFTSLGDLAAFLGDDPSRRVALVGHTDAVGSLDGNIALSKRRAGSVLERLVTGHGVARAQLSAEGMGYLSPITTNLTPAGREANRRVEVILLNTK